MFEVNPKCSMIKRLEFREDNEGRLSLGGGDLLELLMLSWLNHNGGASQNCAALADIPDLFLPDR